MFFGCGCVVCGGVNALGVANLGTSTGFGAGSTVTNQYGFICETLSSATNNYGFYGKIASATNNWNIYMDGTAKNYLNGSLLIGSTTDAGYKLDVTGTSRITISLNIGGTTTDTSAILQTDSTTKGVLFPRMTTTQKNAISSPATGLTIFDTTLGKLCVYSTTWQTLTSV